MIRLWSDEGEINLTLDGLIEYVKKDMADYIETDEEAEAFAEAIHLFYKYVSLDFFKDAGFIEWDIARSYEELNCFQTVYPADNGLWVGLVDEDLE